MKTIRFHEIGGPEVLQLQEVPDLKPSAGQVVVRVRASARARLIAAAAEAWGGAPAACQAKNGAVVRAASGRAARFGGLAVPASSGHGPATRKLAISTRGVA